MHTFVEKIYPPGTDPIIEHHTSFTWQLQATDLESNVTFQADDMPDDVSLSSSGELTWDPVPQDIGWTTVPIDICLLDTGDNVTEETVYVRFRETRQIADPPSGKATQWHRIGHIIFDQWHPLEEQPPGSSTWEAVFEVRCDPSGRMR